MGVDVEKEKTGPGAPADVLAFLIADVRGYTTFTRERGDVEAARLATRFADLAGDAVAARSGELVEVRGDEVFAVFRTPAQAVRAALELQATLSEESSADPTLPLPAGIGIAVGEAVRVGEGYRGSALNLAARLCSRAAAGQVLLSAEVVEKAGDVHPGHLRELGQEALKGFAEPVSVYEAVAAADRLEWRPPPTEQALPVELIAETPLVGRGAELAWLRGTWRTVKRGHGRLLLVSGPSGIGKTRIAQEFASWVGEQGAQVLYGGAGGAGGAQALSLVATGCSADSPTLVVLDDLDLFDDAAAALAHAREDLSERPTLVLGLFRQAGLGTPLGDLVVEADDRGDEHRPLGSLGLEDARQIVEEYAGAGVVDAPLESIMRSSSGVPSKIHEAAANWSRDEGARRLADAAEWFAQNRRRQEAGYEFAGTAIGLRLGRLHSSSAGVRMDRCPYKGLASFQQSDAAAFFGRERLVGELAARTVGVGLLGVAGPSGSGKSSVIMAGLLPSLAAGVLPGSESWYLATKRPGECTPHELRGIRDLAGERRLVVAIDQFEEIFTLMAPAERDAFIEEVVALAADPEGAVVVLTIRTDFIGDTTPYRELSELLSANLVLVGPMTDQELTRAIEYPARRAGVRVESALTSALVDEIADEPGGLPLLSTALVELWETRDHGWLRLQAYEHTGGVRGAVARLAEESFSHLEGPEREVARAVLVRLAVGERDAPTRRQVPMSEFAGDEDRLLVISRFTSDRLLTITDGSVEVAHEALLTEWPRLRSWLEEDAEGRGVRLRLTESSTRWQQANQDPGELLRGASLTAALDWATHHGRELNAAETAFLGASRAAADAEMEAQRRANRRLRGLLAGLAAFLVLAVIAAVVALVQRSNAQTAATQALSQRLGAQGLTQSDLGLSLLLARESVNIDDSTQTHSYLLSALQRSPNAVRIFRPLPGHYLGVFTNPSGSQFLVGPTSDARWALVDTASGRIALQGVSAMPALSAAGDQIGVINAAETRASIIEVATRRTIRSVRLPHQFAPNHLFFGGAWAPNLHLIALRIDPAVTPNTTSQVYVLNTASGRTVGLPPPPGTSASYNFVAFSPDSRYLAGVSGATPGRQFITVWRSGRYRSPVAQLAYPAYHQGATALAINNQDTKVAVGGSDGSVSTFEMKGGDHHAVVFAGRHGATVNGLEFTQDGRSLVSVGADHQVIVWSVALSRLEETFDGHSDAANGPAITANGATAYSASADGSVIEWDLAGRRSLARPLKAAGGTGGYGLTIIAASADHRVIALPQNTPRGTESVPNGNAEVVLRNARTLARLRTIIVGHGATNSMALNPQGTVLAAEVHTSPWIGPQVTLWSVASGRRLAARLPGPARSYTAAGIPTNDVEALAFSPHGTLAGVDDAGKVYLWSVPAGRLIAVLTTRAPAGQGNGGVSVTFNSDGTLLAAAHGSFVTVWKAGSRKTQYTIAQSGPVTFSPDGKLLAVGGGDGLVRFYSAATGKPDGRPVRGDAAGLATLRFTADGRTLLAAGSDGSARLIDVASRTQIGSPLQGAVDTSGGIGAVTGNGTTVIEAYDTGELYEWDLSPGALEARACAIAGRNLTASEWQAFLGSRPYQPICRS